MAGKSTAFENDILKLIFNGTAISLIADNAATTPLTNLYVSIHTADPTDAGTQSSNEISYTGYARVPVVRGAGWNVTASSVSPAANVDFGNMTGGTGGTWTHWAIGTLATGTGKLLYTGTVAPNVNIAIGSTPRLSSATSVTEG